MPITNPKVGLTFGALDLLGKPAAPYWFEAAGDGHDQGNPVPVEREVTSFLQDGTISSLESYDNREMTLTVAIKATSTAGLAAGEAALMAEVGRRNSLVWTPPEVGGVAGVPCVFDVVTSHLDFTFDDVLEIQSLTRVYKLTIKAAPFASSTVAQTAVSPAPPISTAAVLTLDDGTSATNWSVTATRSVGSTPGPALPVTLAVVNGGLEAKITNATTADVSMSMTLTRTGLSGNMATRPYLRVESAYNRKTGAGVIFDQGTPTAIYANGSTSAQSSAVAAQNGSVSWLTFNNASTLNRLDVYFSPLVSKSGGTATLRIDDLALTDAPYDGSAGQRQVFRSLAVGGSVRTQGNLALADESAALGSTLVYTTPATTTAAQPPLRVFRTAGSTEATDLNSVSGKTSVLTTLHSFDIPAPQVPAGGYLLMARIKNPTGTPYALTWSGKTRMGTTTLDTNTPNGTVAGTLVTDTWTIVPIARMTLPTVQVGPAGFVRVDLQSTTTGLMLDEAWLFNLDEGRLTWVECGTGTPTTGGASNRLWIDAASLANPVPSVKVGKLADRSDSYGAGQLMQSFGDHQFTPPMTNVFTVTTNSIATAATLTYNPRFHSHVVAQ